MAAVILASRSPQRKALLAELGYRFDIIAPRVDETVEAGMSAEATARTLARRKADDVAKRVTAGVVIGADTLVMSNTGAIIGKAADEADARRILAALSGSAHRIISGLAVLDLDSGNAFVEAVTTTVHMKRMTPEEIAGYVRSGEWVGKAGAYAIQQHGDRFVEKVEGSFTNVVGLPTERLRAILDTLGIEREAE